jgi:hypothetical protein
VTTGEQLYRAWWEMMQVRTPAESALNMWADWVLTCQQAATRAVSR